MASLLAVAVLGIVVFGVFSRGASALSLGFLTKNLPKNSETLGGIGPALAGTALLTRVATAIAMPLGILIALYLNEFANARLARVIRLALDLMNGLPTIIVGRSSSLCWSTTSTSRASPARSRSRSSCCR